MKTRGQFSASTIPEGGVIIFGEPHGAVNAEPPPEVAGAQALAQLATTS